MFACFHENKKTLWVTDRKGLVGFPSQPHHLARRGMAAAPRGESSEIGVTLSTSSCVYGRGARGSETPALLLQNVRASARSDFFLGPPARRVGIAVAVSLFRRRQFGPARDWSIAFCSVDFARRRNRCACRFQRSSQIVNCRTIPIRSGRNETEVEDLRKGALMRCRGQQLKRLPSGILSPQPRPLSGWRSTILP